MVMTLAERFDVTSSRRIEANIAIASLTSPILITIEGKRDFSEPVALFYRGGEARINRLASPTAPRR